MPSKHLFIYGSVFPNFASRRRAWPGARSRPMAVPAAIQAVWFGGNLNYLRKVNVRLMPNPKSIFLYLCIFPAHKGGKGGGGWEMLLQRVNQHAAHATFIMQLFTCTPVCKLIINTSRLHQNRMFFFVFFGNVCCTLVPFWEACFCQEACC